MLNNKAPTLLKADVREYTEPIYKLLAVDEHEHMPPEATFEWGKMKFVGFIVAINEKFTMFSSKGVPLRSTLEITMKSSKKDNMIRNSPDRTKHRTVKSGDRLYSFAYAEYRNCGEWRKIAEANGIDNPRRLKTGESIIIPAIT
jgi:nucleoid-associated protein YgaU